MKPTSAPSTFTARLLRGAVALLSTTGSFSAVAADFNSLPAAQRTEIHRLTDMQFFARHPELHGQRLKANSDVRLRQEYMSLRSQVMSDRLSGAGSAAARLSNSVNPANQWYGDVPPHAGPVGPNASASSAGIGAGAGAGLSRGTLEARANSLAQEASRLAQDYENASPERAQQIRARLQQMYQEALALQKDYLAVAGTTGGNGAGALPGAVVPALNGQPTPGLSLALSPRDYFAQLGEERGRKADVRERQASYYQEGAQDVRGYLAEGQEYENAAMARAALDTVNGTARVGMAFAPKPVYLAYETLNAGADLARDSGYSPLDTELSFHAPFAGQRTDNPLAPAQWGKDIKVAKDVKNIVTGPGKVQDALPPIFVPEDEPNIFNNFGHASDIEPAPSKLSQVGKGLGNTVSFLDATANSAKFGYNVGHGEFYDAAKNALDLGGNYASYVENEAGGRFVSGTKGAVAVSEGVRHFNTARTEKAGMEQSLGATSTSLAQRAEEAKRQAARDREWKLLTIDLSTREIIDPQNLVPPAQGPNQDYFKSE